VRGIGGAVGDPAAQFGPLLDDRHAQMGRRVGKQLEGQENAARAAATDNDMTRRVSGTQ